jgi:hypothetical protein
VHHKTGPRMRRGRTRVVHAHMVSMRRKWMESARKAGLGDTRSKTPPDNCQGWRSHSELVVLGTLWQIWQGTTRSRLSEHPSPCVLVRPECHGSACHQAILKVRKRNHQTRVGLPLLDHHGHLVSPHGCCYQSARPTRAPRSAAAHRRTPIRVPAIAAVLTNPTWTHVQQTVVSNMKEGHMGFTQKMVE